MAQTGSDDFGSVAERDYRRTISALVVVPRTRFGGSRVVAQMLAHRLLERDLSVGRNCDYSENLRKTFPLVPCHVHASLTPGAVRPCNSPPDQPAPWMVQAALAEVKGQLSSFCEEGVMAARFKKGNCAHKSHFEPQWQC